MSTLHHPFIYLVAILFGSLSLTAQTTLGPGDIAFTGYNADTPDEFSIVLLKDVVATTTITFTDDEYGNPAAANPIDNILNTGEGRLTLTFGASFTCSTEFYFLNGGTSWSVTDGSGSSSNLSLASASANNLALTTAGEAIFAFQDANPLTSNPASWIAGLNMTGTVWTLGNGSGNDSQLPPSLTNGLTANAITPEVDNAKYDCSTTNGPPGNLAVAINTQSNWQVNNDILFTLNGAGFCGFTCAASCTDPVLTSVSSTPEPVCLGATATINITGSINSGGTWSLRTGSCTGPVQQTTATNSFSVSPTLTTTYYITAPNCNLTTSVCNDVTVTVSGIQANAGPDQLVSVASATLEGNNPAPSSGSWSIISGDGNGNIVTPSSPNSTFSGTAGEAYTLQWSIDGGACGTSVDEVKISFSSPTDLLLGELAFTEYVSSNPDYFSVLMLTDIKAGTEVHFTDKGWHDPILSPPGGFRAGEGTLTATWCAAYTCGSEFKLSDTAGGVGTSWDIRDASGNVAGTVVVSGGSAFTISTAGDQIFAYQSSVPTEGDQSNFLSAIHMNGNWDADADGTTTSAQPSTFANILNANTFVVPNPTGAELDNAIYNCAVTASTVGSLQIALSNPGNWTNSNTRPANPNFCDFSCQACEEPVITSVSQNPNPVCAGEPVTINVTGSLNGSTQWEVYNDSCDGTIVGSSTTNQISFTANAAGTYYIAGVNGCVATPNCTSFTLTLDGVVADIATDVIKVPQGTTTTTISGNTPPGGATISWTFVDAGDGNGVIASPSSASTSFSGTAGQSYELRYTIQRPGCPSTSDEVLVVFLDPTDLELGDIAFLSYNATSDDFAMVLLTDVNAGTQITLTERGWFDTGGFRSGEQTFSMEFCRAYSCGAEIDIFQVPELLILDVNDKTAGTLVNGLPLALSISGDQIFVYQGAEPTGGDQNNFLAAIQMNGNWDANATSAATSALPSDFTDGVNAISISPEVNNASYDCSTTGPADGATLALSINDANNWNRSENSPYPLPLACGISCCADATINSVTASSSEFCSGETVTLTVSGSLNDATMWVWYEGGCAQGVSLGTGTSIMVTPGAATTYFVRGEDGCVGNTGSCEMVTVTPENTPPSISCPAVSTVGNDAGQCTAVVNYTPPVGTDNCSGATTALTAGLGTGAAFPVGATTETYTVTAANGQTASCSFTVTVSDSENPTVDCAAVDGNRNNDTGFCSYTVQGNEFDPASSDNCPGVSITNNYNNASSLAGVAFPVGTTPVTWTALDAAGGTATCSVDIVVTDNEDPVLTCQDVTIQLGSNGVAGFNIFISVPPAILTQSDNCGLQGGAYRSGPAVFTCAELGDNTIFIFKNDVNDNQTTCQFTLTVDDTDFPCNEPPVANCKNVTVDADTNCQGTAAAADFNDGSTDPDMDPLTFSVAPGGPYPLGVTNVILTVSDGQVTDQCNATITVVDNDAPVADCSAINPSRNNDPGQCNFTMQGKGLDAAASDNCGVTSLTNDYNNGTTLLGATFPVGTTMVTWTAMDAAGNSHACSIDIVITDAEAPVADCAAINPNRNSDPGQCNFTMLGTGFDPTATDNCGVTSLTNDYNNGSSLAGTTFPVGTTPVTWTAMDAAGNSHVCSIDVVITDNEPANAECQSATIAIDANGNATLAAPDIDGGSSENCGIFTLSIDIVNFGCYELGDHIVTLTATDNLGQFTTCTATVTVTGPDADCDRVADICDLCPGGDDQVNNNSDDLPDCAYFPGLQYLIDEWKCSRSDGKVTVCHIPDGNFANRSDICVNPNAVAAHLAHGDFIGGCESVTCDPSENLANNQEDHPDDRSPVYRNTALGLEGRALVYPNPTNSLLNVDLSGFAGQKMTLKLINAQGQVMICRSIGVQDHQLESLQLGFLPSGVYWLKVETQNEVPITKRIVVQGRS